MANKIVLVGGSKGGVGKSMVSLSLIDRYLEKGYPVALVETDTSNPDVYKIYKDTLDGRTQTFDLDNKDGWLKMINYIDSDAKDHDVVINTAARNNIAIENYGKLLNDALEDLGRHLITLWPINRQKDSLQLLHEYMATMTASEIFVLRNLYFGEPDKFQFYNTSKIKTTVEEKWATFDLSDLADRVADELVSKRQTVAAAMATLPMGDRIELKRWRTECGDTYDKILWGI